MGIRALRRRLCNSKQRRYSRFFAARSDYVGAVNDVLPFDDTVVVLTLRGSDVQDLFDYSASMRDAGAFLQVSSEVALMLSGHTGACESVLIQGSPIDPLRTYTVAVNSYLADGGDGYTMLLRAIDKYDLAAVQRDVFMNYIESLGGRIRPGKRDRIRVVKQSSPFVKGSQRGFVAFLDFLRDYDT